MPDFRNRIVETRIVTASELAQNSANFRRHPEPQAKAVRGLLNEVGIVAPLIAYHSERAGGALTLIDGHMRQEIGGEWPVTILNVSDQEADLILASLDYTTSLAELDSAALADLLGRVQMTPVEDDGVRELLAQLAAAHVVEPTRDVDAAPQVDRAGELQQVWGTATGQIWQIAQHFVICGDCREPETWQRLLSAAGLTEVNGVFTSPPYAEQRKEQYGGVPADEYVDWWEAVQANVKDNLADDGSFFVNIKPHCEDGQRVLYVCDLVLAMVRHFGWRFIEEFCWLRNPTPKQVIEHFKQGFEPVYQFSLGKFKFNPDDVRHESENVPIPGGKGTGNTNWAGRQGRIDALANTKGNRPGMAYPSTVLDFAKSGGLVESHAAAFPVALPDFFVRAYSDRGDVWCDPFCGSGTTIVAAHQNDRIGLGMEMLPKYVAVILERLQTVTECKPVLLEAECVSLE